VCRNWFSSSACKFSLCRRILLPTLIKLLWHFLEFNPLNAELNPICHLMALWGAHHILHVSETRVNIYINKIHALWSVKCFQILHLLRVFLVWKCSQCQ
jgi:hypothetical protein